MPALTPGDGTLTPEAVAYFEALAAEAREDIGKLPESSQPLWFRTQGMIQG